MLNRIPAYATAVTELMRSTAILQEKALRARASEPAANAKWEREKAGKKLARLRRAYRERVITTRNDR